MHKFLVLEGIDGVGKSELVKATVAMLVARGEPALPCSAVIGESLLLPAQKQHIRSHASLEESFLLYLASALHKAALVRKALTHHTVVMDRYIDSVRAHHVVRGLPEHCAARMVSSVDLLIPDYTFHIRVPEDERLRRVRARARSCADDFESAATSATFLGKKRLWFEEHVPTAVDNDRALDDAARQICAVTIR